ncbi:MAG: hypothetical protein U5K76_03495 [Woeseiaceae bacterium]|nr:hypothetical protein [Woeseiaceae bacterium]
MRSSSASISAPAIVSALSAASRLMPARTASPAMRRNKRESVM